MSAPRPTLGRMEPDPMAVMLGTGYMRFESPTGICGLCKDAGNRLDILAVDTFTPGKGQFRAFIKLCKEEFQVIYIWEIWNEFLPEVLKRYGFEPCEMDWQGEHLTGMRWEAHEPPTTRSTPL